MCAIRKCMVGSLDDTSGHQHTSHWARAQQASRGTPSKGGPVSAAAAASAVAPVPAAASAAAASAFAATAAAPAVPPAPTPPAAHRLVAVIVYRLLAQQAQRGLLLLRHSSQQPRNRQRLQLLLGIHLDVDGSVSPHGQRRTQRLLRAATGEAAAGAAAGPASGSSSRGDFLLELEDRKGAMLVAAVAAAVVCLGTRTMEVQLPPKVPQVVLRPTQSHCWHA